MSVFFKSAIGVGVVFALMGCEPAPELKVSAVEVDSADVSPAQVKSTDFNAFKFQWFPAFVGVESGQKPVRLRGLNNAQLRKALRLVDADACDDFKKCGKMAEKKLNGKGDKGKTSRFTGLGASGVATLINIAKKTDVGANVKVWAKGQIQTNCLDENGVVQPGRPGYSYYEPRGHLRICVVVRTTTENAAGDKKSTFEYFEVEARNVEYEKRCEVGSSEPRCAGATVDNVFPVAAQKTKLQIPESKTRPAGFQMNWKLYGWGDNIKVKRYGLIRDVPWTTNMAPVPVWNSGNIYSRPQGHGNLTNYLKKLFAENDGACVDMMFAERPPATLSTTERVVYCLGRCDNPPILNTL